MSAVMTERRRKHDALPQKLVRGLLILTSAWPGKRVAEKSLLIKIHEPQQKEKLPLIWCGGPPELPFIIETIGNTREIYGLRGTYDFVEPTDEVIAKLGVYYADEIERAIPQGPYLLAGYCAAAYISMEIARILVERGHKIAFLGLIERDVTEQSRALYWARKLFNRFDMFGTILVEIVRAAMTIPKVQAWQQVKQVLHHRLGRGHTKQDPREQIRYIRRTDEKMYDLKPFSSDIHLYFIRWGVFGYYQLPHFKRCWQKLTQGRAFVHFVSGCSHLYPNWTKISQQLQRDIEKTGI